LTRISPVLARFEGTLFWGSQVTPNADSHAINSAANDIAVAAVDNQSPAVQRMFDTDSAPTDMAAKLGLPTDCAYQIVEQVGSPAKCSTVIWVSRRLSA